MKNKIKINLLTKKKEFTSSACLDFSSPFCDPVPNCALNGPAAVVDCMVVAAIDDEVCPVESLRPLASDRRRGPCAEALSEPSELICSSVREIL